jgi:hypothetical protein
MPTLKCKRRSVNQIFFLFPIQNSEVNNVWNVNHNPKGNYKIECRAWNVHSAIKNQTRTTKSWLNISHKTATEVLKRPVLKRVTTTVQISKAQDANLVQGRRCTIQYVDEDLLLYCCKICSRIFRSYVTVITAGENCKIEPYARCSGPLSKDGSFCATPAVTLDLDYSSLIRRINQCSRLLQHAKGWCGTILTRIPRSSN